MSKLHAPFRFDYVGSFLRPENLLQARTQFEKSEISASDLKKIEDDAITDLVAKQKKAESKN